MQSEQFSPALSDLLFEKTDEFIGIYDLEEGRFKRVNQAGVRLLGFVSEQELLADPVKSRSIRTPPLSEAHRGSLLSRVMNLGTYQETALIDHQTGLFWSSMHRSDSGSFVD